MTTPTTCSWCSSVNDAQQRWCKTCGHSALHPREECDCRCCLGVLFVEGTDQTGGKPTTPAARGRAAKPSAKIKRRT